MNIENYCLLRGFAHLRICGCFHLKLELSLLLVMPARVFNSPTCSRQHVLAHDFPHFLLLCLKLRGFSSVLKY